MSEEDDGRPLLNPRQMRFVEEYAISLNATEAYIKAGYSQTGANAAASKLLADYRVKMAVDELLQARTQRAKVTADRVLAEIANLAYADIHDVVERASDGSIVLRDLSKIAPQTRRAIESIRIKTLPGGGQQSEVKMHSKTTALKLLADHLGLNAPVKHQIEMTEFEGKSTADLEAELAATKVGPRE